MSAVINLAQPPSLSNLAFTAIPYNFTTNPRGSSTPVWDTTLYRYTVPATGQYFITFAIVAIPVNAVTTSASVVLAGLIDAGTPAERRVGYSAVSLTANTYVSIALSTSLTLNAGQTITPTALGQGVTWTYGFPQDEASCITIFRIA